VSFLLLLLIAFPYSSYASTNFESLGRKAISENAAESASAVAELRATGPAGLDSLLSLYRTEINRHISSPTDPATPEWLRLSAALDAVSQQKDSYLSGLYWYTDLSQAEAAAKSNGKPILSLRLLGNLNDEFSCANSRFFRTVLYSNVAVSKALRERFILHWQSVRPAPRVTIDFGDGRKLERTITGNSIHYVLDADGHVIDALPGLYGPAAFLKALAPAEEISQRLRGMSADEQVRPLGDYHRAAVQAITKNWLEDTREIGGRIAESLLPKPVASGSPRALDISALAMGKAVAEVSILRAITKDADALGAMTDEATWMKIARRHLADAQLDEQSTSLMRRQMQSLWEKDPPNGSGPTPGMKLMTLLTKFQLNVALDSVRNEYVLHTKVHALLTVGRSRENLDALNQKVYAEIFLSPKSDPWMGLFSDDVYTALENGGVVRSN
jgi:hypothetical protein